MNLRTFLASLVGSDDRATKILRQRAALGVESLETRTLLASNMISGFVFHDANGNGLFDSGEAPLAGSTIELHNSDGVVVGTAVTDDAGFYFFDHDATIDPTVTTLTHTLVFPDASANQTQQGFIQQFDPTLGILESVEVRVDGHLVSNIQVENRDPAATTITASVSGDLTVTAPGIDSEITTGEVEDAFAAGPYDGVMDFAGTSGTNFGDETVNGTGVFMLTDAADLAAYTGTGNVTYSLVAHSSAVVSGGGNMAALISSQGGASVEVIYHYRPDDSLKPGSYTIVQTGHPEGYVDGKESKNGNVLPGSIGSDSIAVTLGNADLSNNNFGELRPAAVGGLVYVDADNDGVKDAGEAGIEGALITLTGTNDVGQAVNLTATTAADGSYSFTGLRPGTYTIQETQPTGYLDGKDTLGNTGGTKSNDRFQGIVLKQATAASGYNFGELTPSSLGGTVFNDTSNDGNFDFDETGIAGATVTLTGTDDLGNSVRLTQLTGSDGSYLFSNLRPGTYTITETQPAGYLDGLDTVGSEGGNHTTNDRFNGIALSVGAQGTGYNFGELPAASFTGWVYADNNNNGVKDTEEAGIAGVKLTLTGINDLGQNVNVTAQTGADGSYSFIGLRPGTYTLTETHPAGWMDGYDTAGSHGGTVESDRISDITLRSGAAASEYNFGEMAPASLAGFVYKDKNDNGRKDADEKGIESVLITLTGTDDQGNAVTLTQRTDANGAYRFANLRPGTYTLTERQPNEFLDGKDSVGTLGGVAGPDQFNGIVVDAGDVGRDYNFGEGRKKQIDGPTGTSDDLSKFFFLGSTQMNRQNGT
jgi:protocatechuate 3,4-dioxygenase beta subunit